MDHPHLSGLLTTRETIALVRLSRTSLYRMSRQGRFPPPCSVGNGQIRWREDDVRAWMAALPTCTYAQLAGSAATGSADRSGAMRHG